MTNQNTISYPFVRNKTSTSRISRNIEGNIVTISRELVSEAKASFQRNFNVRPCYNCEQRDHGRKISCHARSTSGPVAKSLREEKKRKKSRKFASVSNERKIEQVKLSLHRQTPFVGNRACCGFRFAKMSLRLQTNDRLDPLEATRCGGPFIHRGRAARKVSPSLRENSRIGRLHGEINSRQPRCTQLSRLDHLVFRVIGLETSPIESFRTTA